MLRSAVFVLAALAWAGAARAQEFERLEGPMLAGLPESPAVRACDSVSVAEMAALPMVFKESRATPLVIKTDQGNLARLLVAPGYRKTPGVEGGPVPTFVLERFETFAMPGARDRLARGRDLTLFGGFEFDLDTGQVVPAGQGGDVRMVVEEGENKVKLAIVGAARMYLFQGPLPGKNDGNRPSSGRLVVPGDFTGRYRLFANGQWTGSLELTVTDGDVAGRFRSDQTGTSYAVTGQTGSPANRIRFTVTLPRTKLEYDGHLFTDGKGAIAGTVTLLERPLAFFALREGGVVNPEGEEADHIIGEAPAHGLVLEGTAGSYRLDGREVDDEALAKALMEAVRDDPARWVLYRVRKTTPYEAVARTIERVRAAGIDVVRIQPMKEGP